MKNQAIKLIECPRDALQGLTKIVPTQLKIDYLHLLLQVGFNTLDFGSFVSPKAIPQMADTAEVIQSLDLSLTNTKLLAIVANEKGMKLACEYSQITYIGYPFSISETFQRRNTNAGISESLELLKNSQEIIQSAGKELVVYLSMAFGNPYGDKYSEDVVLEYASKMQGLGCRIISLADTIGMATPEEIISLGTKTINSFPEIEIGMHLHATPDEAQDKVEAALKSKCIRLDSALGGLGGCPFAEDELTGNIPTEVLLKQLSHLKISHKIDLEKLDQAKAFLNEKILIH